MKIEVLGDGCFLCSKTYENVLEAVRLSGKDGRIVKTMDIHKIAGAQVLSMPAIMIDGAVKVCGKVPTVDDILEWIA